MPFCRPPCFLNVGEKDTDGEKVYSSAQGELLQRSKGKATAVKIMELTLYCTVSYAVQMVSKPLTCRSTIMYTWYGVRNRPVDDGNV